MYILSRNDLKYMRDVHSLYANSTVFYLKDLGICGFLCGDSGINSSWIPRDDYMYVPHIYSSIYGHLGFFPTLTIVNNSAVNIGVQISLQNSGFNSLDIYI